MKLHCFALVLGSFLPPTTSIDVVEVRGNDRVSEETIVFHLRSLLGKTPTEDQLRTAFRSLWETGLFLDVRFELEPLQSGNPGQRLVVFVEEKPLLVSVQILGEEHSVDRAQLLERLRGRGFDLRAGKPFSEEEARRAARATEEILNGDYVVSMQLSPSEDAKEWDLIIELRKKSLPRISRIDFEGNRRLSDAELRKVMWLRGSNWTSWATGRDRLRPEMLEEDLARLLALYRERGYLEARVGTAREEMAKDRLHLVLTITEGERFRFAELTSQAGSLLREDLVHEWLPLAPGDFYDAVAVDGLVERIESHYRNRGYPAVRVERREDIDAGQVHLALRVVEGPPFRVGSIIFRGNVLHRDRDLRSFLALSEGDRFDWSAMAEGTHRLSALSGFLAVRHEVRLLPETGVAQVVYHLDEAPRFDYLVGGGADGTQGVTGSGQLQARSLLGRGETLRLDLDAGARFQNFGFGYHDPFVLGKRFIFSADFLRNALSYPDETSQALNHFQIRLAGPSAARWQLQGLFRIAQFELGSTLEQDVPFLSPFLDRRIQTNRLGLALAYEGRDPRLFSTRGLGLVFGGELVGGAFGGDVDALRLSARATQVVPFGDERRHLLVLSGRTEMVRAFGATETEGLARFERLFLGSENDLRGFSIRAVGPRDGDVVVGGDRLIFASAEYQYVVTKRLRVAIFFDTGNVFATDFEGLRLPSLRYDAGGEIQVMAPLLNVPFRLGYGFNLDPVADESRGRLYGTLSFRF